MVEKSDGFMDVRSIQNRIVYIRVLKKRNFLFVVLALGALIFQETFGRQIEFVSEEIELTVADSTCTVQGLYWFRNKNLNSAKMVLFYPFVVNDRLPYPDTVNVVEGGSGHPVAFTKSNNGIYFSITVCTSQTALYRVLYVQKTATQSMEYLLRTTAQWRKPLEYALYRVRVPEKCLLISSTILFTQIYKQDSEWIYEACEEQFMPSTDFIIRWQRREP